MKRKRNAEEDKKRKKRRRGSGRGRGRGRGRGTTSRNILQHLGWQHLASCGTIWPYLGTSGSIWHLVASILFHGFSCDFPQDTQKSFKNLFFVFFESKQKRVAIIDGRCLEGHVHQVLYLCTGESYIPQIYLRKNLEDENVVAKDGTLMVTVFRTKSNEMFGVVELMNV